MIKKWSFYTTLTIIIAFLSSGFKASELDSTEWFLINETDATHYLFPSKKPTEYTNLNIPYTGKFFIGYKEAIGFKESQGKYKKINSLGYLGKYQFGRQTLKSIGIEDCEQFLNSPAMQEKAFVTLLAKNKSELRNIIKRYNGQIVSGILITESGVLAAAHLGGVGSVKKFFRHKGNRYFRDAYGTSIRSYMQDFGGYETSGIEADGNATLQ